MLKKGIITYILDNYEKIEILNNLTEDEIHFLRDKFDKIQMYKLYKYEIHGIFHSQKVMLFAYLLGKQQNLNDDDMKILLDAAVYHDIGRDSDFEETTHGYSSTLKYDRLFANDNFYNDSVNFELLKAITDGHSVDDSKKRKIFDNYFSENEYYDRYSKLYDILKDADALDRARFPKSAAESIKVEFLRTEFSKSLVDFSFVLNGIYRNKIDEANYEKYKNEYSNSPQNNGCLHGIGWDFCKLESILEYGILSSYAAMKKGVSVSRNFDGNNSNMWISVIDSLDVQKQGSAYKKFADNNISLYSIVRKYKKGETNRAKAQSEGLPIHSSLYDDESFVFYEIPKEDIMYVILPSKSMELKLNQLNYLYCSYGFKTIKSRVEYYCKYIEQLTGIVVDMQNINYFIEELFKLETRFGARPADFQKIYLEDFLREVDFFVNKINEELCKWMNLSFKQYFSLEKGEDATVAMVVEDIFKRKNITYTLMGDSSTEMMFKINANKKEIDSNKRI